MERDRFLSWLTRWLAAHPLRTPDEPHPERYADEVMARITAGPQPRRWRNWMSWPRAGLALGAALAGVLVVSMAVRHAAAPSSASLAREWQVLAALEEDEIADGPLDEDLEAVDRLQLADAAAAVDDAAWIEQTTELFGSVEDASGVESGSNAPDDWDEELRWLDEASLADS